MRLTRLQITNYRSLFGERLDLEVGDSMTSIIGPNNCGKSNLFRALALAMDPSFEFDRARDLPPLGPNTRTRVVCTFDIGTSGPEGTLLERAAEAERELSGRDRTNADDGIVRFAVSCSGTGRKEFLIAKGAGTKQPETPEQIEAARRAVAQLRSVCRFVFVRSGDSLESLLKGRFRELLHTVLEEHQRPEYEQAEAARLDYIAALRNELLGALESSVLSKVGQLFPEVTGVDMEPRVTSLAQSLLDVDVQLQDLVKGGLSDKGTGVRGGVLVAMLRYLADNGRRSVVMAVEEPESFLHPAAQENLRDEFETLSAGHDVSLLVTTHSPFIPSRRADARIVALAKDDKGATHIAGAVAGDDDRTALILGLFRSAAQPELLERAAKEHARAILVVEGWTDMRYLRIAADKLNRTGVLQGLEIVPAGGARQAVRQGLLYKDELPDTPVLVLFDDDPDGQDAFKKLTGTFGFKGSTEVVYYSTVLPSRLSSGVVEAEDLFPTALLDRFVVEQGDECWTGRQKRTKQWGDGWRDEAHIDFTDDAKGHLPDWLARNSSGADFGKWSTLLDKIDQILPASS